MAEKDEARLHLLGDYKGLGPTSEEDAKWSYFCSNLSCLMILLSSTFSRSHPILKYYCIQSFKIVFFS